MALDLTPVDLVTFEKSSRDPKKKYTFGVTSTGILVCNCQGWAVRRGTKPRQCKHTAKLIIANKLTTHITGADNEYLQATHYAGFKVATPKVAGTPKKQVSVDTDDVDTNDSGFVPLMPQRSRFRTFTLKEDLPVAALTLDEMYVNPMLAAHLDDFDLSDFNRALWVMEEKYDGHRVIVAVQDGQVKAWSRPRSGEDAKVRTLPAHILAEFVRFPNGTYDGELIYPGGTSSDVVKLEYQKDLQFVVFDICSLLGNSTIDNTYSDRRKLLTEIFAKLGFESIHLATCIDDISEEVIEQMWAAGKEGVILKRLAAEYQPGARSKDFVKVKKEQSTPMTIIGFETGKLGECSIVKLRDKNGNKTTVKVKNNRLLEEFRKDPDLFIGEVARIKFQDFTPKGGYRHPRWDRWENRAA